MQGSKWAAVTIVVVGEAMLGKVTQVHHRRFRPACMALTAFILLRLSARHAARSVLMMWWWALPQVSIERTIGTVAGGLLGLGTALVGHGFGQDKDVAFTGKDTCSQAQLELLSCRCCGLKGYGQPCTVGVTLRALFSLCRSFSILPVLNTLKQLHM